MGSEDSGPKIWPDRRTVQPTPSQRKAAGGSDQDWATLVNRSTTFEALAAVKAALRFLQDQVREERDEARQVLDGLRGNPAEYRAAKARFDARATDLGHRMIQVQARSTVLRTCIRQAAAATDAVVEQAQTATLLLAHAIEAHRERTNVATTDDEQLWSTLSDVVVPQGRHGAVATVEDVLAAIREHVERKHERALDTGGGCSHDRDDHDRDGPSRARPPERSVTVGPDRSIRRAPVGDIKNPTFLAPHGPVLPRQPR